MNSKAGTNRAAAKTAPDWNRNQVVLPTSLLLFYSRQINPKPENFISWRDLSPPFLRSICDSCCCSDCTESPRESSSSERYECLPRG